MARCRIHGQEYEHWEGCSECRDAEQRTEEGHIELLAALEQAGEEQRAAAERAEAARAESDYRQANPGDYECPECRYITLRRTASRCPKCHATIATTYWVPVLERERRVAEEREREKLRAADEWARGEPERRRKAQAAAEARANLAAEDASGGSGWAVVLVVLVVLGALGVKWFESMQSEQGMPAGRSEPDTQLPAAAAPQRIPEPYRAALAAWLQQDRRFRPAELSDCGCEPDVPAMRASYDNDDPQFVIADLNGDSHEDFAIVLLDRTKDPSHGVQGNTADFDQLWNMAVAVFSGPISTGMRPSALFTGMGSGRGVLLFYSRADNTLLVGLWEGSATPILADGSSFKLWEPPNDPVPRDFTPPVGAEFVGEWYSGGADCMKIFPRRSVGAFSVKIWYCNAGEPESGVNATLVSGRLSGDDGVLLIEQMEPPADWPSWRGPRPDRVLVGTFRYPSPNDGGIIKDVMFASVPDGTLR